MSYRDDHDAALARIEALEQENARLARANAMLLRDREVSTKARVRNHEPTLEVIPLPQRARPPQLHVDSDPLLGMICAVAFVISIISIAMGT